jgi:hypothetical protein
MQRLCQLLCTQVAICRKGVEPGDRALVILTTLQISVESGRTMSTTANRISLQLPLSNHRLIIQVMVEQLLAEAL